MVEVEEDMDEEEEEVNIGQNCELLVASGYIVH